jgi:hypothetical protein
MPRKAIFISYSHDSAEHREKVLRLAERLRQDGLDAQLDQYVEGTPEQGWPRWTLDRFTEADYVLVVCTETYYLRFRGHEVPGCGKGADLEGALITHEIYDARSRTVKFVPLLLEAGQEPFIPEPLRGHTYYELTSDECYQSLYRFLLGQAGVKPSPLGDIRPVSPRVAQPLPFNPESDPPSLSRELAVRAEAPRRLRPLFNLALPTLVLLLLVVISTFWHRPTHVQLDLATARLAFTPGGEERREILNRSVPFSSLVIEDCNSAVFAAEKLEIADPHQLVPATKAGEESNFPPTAWREVKAPNSVKLSCSDPAAKLTLKNPDPAAVRLGLLDRIYFKPGSQVVLEISPGREPAFSLEVETPQDLNLTVGRDLELVADFVKPEGIAVPFPGDLQTWRARLPEAHQTFEITGGKHGMVLIVTPARDQLAEVFAEPLDLPLASVEMLEEQLEGTLTSPLRDKAILSYPDYPAIPTVTIGKGEAVGLGGLSQARLSSLKLDAEKGALLRARFDGIADHATSRAGAFATDRRLTLADTFRYSWRSGLIAVAAAWLLSTTWAAFEVWKQFQE